MPRRVYECFEWEWLCLLVECLPVNIDEGPAVHAVNVEDSVQVIHLVLEDSSWPATGLPCNIFPLLIQTCEVNENGCPMKLALS